jgi:DNA-binding transcriptional ArsR family regulator
MAPLTRQSKLTNAYRSETLNRMVEHTDEHLDHLFQALANATRREIVSLLAKRPYNISELVPQFDMSLAAVSKHVKSLERAGLIDREVIGRTHVCRLNADAMNEAYQWLGGYEKFWQGRLDALEKVLAQTTGGRRGGSKQK